MEPAFAFHYFGAPVAILGIFITLFIMYTILGDSLRSHNMRPSDKIMFSLSFSNLCLNVSQCTFICFEMERLVEIMIVRAMVSYGATSSAWLTSCLCFFHFIKIMQFSSRFLSWLKMKIDILIPWLIMVVELVTLSCSFLNEVLWTQYINTEDVALYNDTVNNNSSKEYQFHELDNFVSDITYVSLGSVIIITAWTSAFLTLHICRMERTTSFSNNANERTKRVLHTMVCLLVCYILYFLVRMLAFVKNESDFSSYFLIQALASLFSCIQSILLIFSNTRYKEKFSSMCLCCRECGK